MQKKLFSLSIYDSVFHRNIVCTVGDPAVVIKTVNRHYGQALHEDDFEDELCGAVFRLTHPTSYSQVHLIWLRAFDMCNAYDVGTLTHEAGHATFQALSCIGVQHTKDTDEVYAYYTDNIVTQFIKNYKEFLCKNQAQKKSQTSSKSQTQSKESTTKKATTTPS